MMSTDVRRRLGRGLLYVANRPRALVKTIVAVYVLCSLTFSVLEGTGPIEGLWWGVVTASTVGYGDYSPATTPGRFVGVVLIVAMYALSIMAGAALAKALLEDPDAWTHEEQEEIKSKVDAIYKATVTNTTTKETP